MALPICSRLGLLFPLEVLVKSRTMPTCCAPGCTRTKEKNYDCSFFTLPWNEPSRIRLWLSKLKLVHPPAKTARICHLHFEERFLAVDPKYKIAPHLYPKKKLSLTPDAYPSIFEHVPVPKKREASVNRSNKRARQVNSELDRSKQCIYMWKLFRV